MRILYNFWGYLSDKIGISSADGNFSYSWSIINELVNRRYKVYGPLINRDKDIVNIYGQDAFKSFSTLKRINAYNNIIFGEANGIDILLLEWRFKTHYNQLDSSHINFHHDLLVQNNLLLKYAKSNIPLRVLNLDNQLTVEDEEYILSLGYRDVVILEQSLYPVINLIPKRTIFIPFDFNDILQFPMNEVNLSKELVYIGNDYNRRHDIESKIIRYARRHPYVVTFIGNWLKDDQKEFREKCKYINFKERIGANEFRDNLKDAIAVPLLSSEDYKKLGHMTMRILETLLFGSIPIGFSDFKGIDLWLPKSLIISIIDTSYYLSEAILDLKTMSLKEREKLREYLVTKLSFHDVKFFVNTLLQ